MSVSLYSCRKCGHFSHEGFLMVDSTSCYDYQCPMCDSKDIETEYTDDEYFTEVETAECEDNHEPTDNYT
mgnify:CR=1 FL=1